MRKLIAGILSVFALMVATVGWAGPINLLDDFSASGTVENTVTLNGQSYAFSHDINLDRNDAYLSWIYGIDDQAIAFAGSGGFAGDDWFGLGGLSFSHGAALATSAASFTVDFIATNAFDMLFDYALAGDADLYYSATRNGESSVGLPALMTYYPGDSGSLSINAATFGNGAYYYQATASPVSVPEPSSLGLLTAGLFAIAFAQRRRREVPH